MFGRLHHWFLAAPGFLGVATAWADAGYLPQGRPLPLRFRVPPPPIVEPAIVPVAPPVQVFVPAPPEAPKPPEPIHTPPPPKVVVTNAPPVEYNARDPIADLPQTLAPDSVIVPQMLIKYFTPQANSTNTPAGTGTQFGFTPPPVTMPAPAPPARSKATYSTPP